MGRTAWGKSALIKLSPILSFKEVTRASQMLKNPPAMPETWVQSPSWEDPWRRKWIHTPVSLPGEFHGQRSLAGYSPWGHKESDMTERLILHFTCDLIDKRSFKKECLKVSKNYLVALDLLLVVLLSRFTNTSSCNLLASSSR